MEIESRKDKDHFFDSLGGFLNEFDDFVDGFDIV